MMTQLVEMSVFRADPAIPYTMTFINDWQAHIDALLPSGAYDLSFPWIRPNCEAPETLSPGDQVRCSDFVFSGPFYEIVDGFFALRSSGLAAATDYAEFSGKRICRPEGYTTGVLDAAGLTATSVTLVRPILATDCFKALASGEVDLVSIDAEVGDAAAARLGLTAEVEQNPQLFSLLSLHVIAHKSNARAVDLIGQLDAGLIEMYQSGEWYEIVSTALQQNDRAE
jgi:polar amino acid transport system substrate-binding protein